MRYLLSIREWPGVIWWVLVGAFCGGVLSVMLYDPPQFGIRIGNHSDCRVSSLYVDVEDITVELKGSHRPVERRPVTSAEVVQIPISSASEFVVRATFENCDAMASPAHSVEPGDTMYVRIESGQFVVQQRS